MKIGLLLAALVLAAAAVNAQVPDVVASTDEAKTPIHEPVDDRAELKRAVPDEGHETKPPSPPLGNDEDTEKPNPLIDYVRPNAKQRFRNYIDSIGGPTAMIYITTTAGLLTLRNSPKEWGTKSDGFGRRFANVAGKNAIRSTTIYGLDELLKVDSTFYRSRDRSVLARMRNSVFSAVTARNRRGKRVIGIPAIAGNLLSEVTASSGWYPNRYDYVHGLKGGAITVGISAGLNLFKEFVWKH